jgi:predicted Na+-dependent transporter
MKSSKLKQLISDILSLKYKRLTILLGTIVPFFACHIMASAGNKVRGRYTPYLIIALFLTSIAYIFLIALIIAVGINWQSLSVLDISVLVIILVIYCGFNYLISTLFYTITLDLKNRLLNEQS